MTLHLLLLVFVTALAYAAQNPPPPGGGEVLAVDRAMRPEEQQQMDQMNAFANVYARYARTVAVGHFRDLRTEHELVAAWLTLANGPARLPIERKAHRGVCGKFFARGD